MAAKFGDDWYRALRSYEEAARDAEYERHLDGDCDDDCGFCLQAKELAEAQAFTERANKRAAEILDMFKDLGVFHKGFK